MSADPSPAPRLVGAALILLGVGAAITSFLIPLDQYGRWGARMFPLGASIVLICLGAVEVISSSPKASQTKAELKRNGPAILALLGLSLLYIWAMARFGYLASTFVAAPVALWIFGVRHPLGLLLAAFLCPGMYHLIFFELLGVFPPLGDWFDLLDVFGGY
ncbi:tripartite tricarboxylate transporter TctB family protein [Aestuariibius insulae]|uniref:tripartite tricarboxylate transporter TctB family protein n=1 Tax=Aestuariibius insulae TaxID=2058287 RepID=UPI00345ECBED